MIPKIAVRLRSFSRVGCLVTTMRLATLQNA
jgi:hypothetical protein